MVLKNLYLVEIKYNALATFPHKNEYIMSAVLFEANFPKKYSEFFWLSPFLPAFQDVLEAFWQIFLRGF